MCIFYDILNFSNFFNIIFYYTFCFVIIQLIFLIFTIYDIFCIHNKTPKIYEYSTLNMCIIFLCSFHNTLKLKNDWRLIMVISEKELSALNELLSEEELLIKKFQMLAQHSTDEEVKEKFTAISNEHKEHFRSLYSQLNG